MSNEWLGTAIDALAGAGKGAAAGSVVPGIGTAVGGLIGLATSLGGHFFGDDAKPALAAAAAAITGAATEQEQVAILSSDPAAIAQFKLEAMRIAADREAAQLQAQTDTITARLTAETTERAGARNQTLQLAQQGSAIAWGAPVISIINVLGLFGALVALLYVKKIEDAGVSAMCNMIIGVLVGSFALTTKYWLGDIQRDVSSARKTELIGQSVPGTLMPNPAAVVPAADVPK